MSRSITTFLCVLGGSAVLAGPAFAKPEPYVSIAAGLALQSDSGNTGTLDAGFVTGQGTTIPSGTALGGEAVSWTTEFETGVFVAGAAGIDWGLIRTELEIGFQDADVSGHKNVVAAGTALANEDAAVLIPNASAIGTDVATLVADGRGQVDQLTAFGNVLFDIEFGRPFSVYVGAGAGIMNVDVTYEPSLTTIVEDEQTVFGYQALAGVNFNVSDELDVTAGYRFRMSEDVEVDTALFPGVVEVENRSSNFELGLRYRF